MKKYFLTGLATLLPLAVTLYVVIFVVQFLTRPFIGIATKLLSGIPIGSFGWISREQWIYLISQVLILISLFVFLLLLGVIARRLFFNTLINWGERLLQKIPLFNKIYKAAREVIRSLFSTSKNSFKQVVLLEFPHKGCYCLGLITNDAPKSCSANLKDDMVTVFIPTTPNPMSGFMTMSPRSKLVFLKMKSDEAIKYVVSCGVIQPGRGEE